MVRLSRRINRPRKLGPRGNPMGKFREYTGKWIIYRPESKLWIGECDTFIHACHNLFRQIDHERWFVGHSDTCQTIINGRDWVRLNDPIKMRTTRKRDVSRLR